MSTSESFFYRPEDAWAADFIPFCQDGVYHLFYLLDWRDREGHGEGTPWYQVSTRDFVRFTEHDQMLARGAPDEQDLYVFTGSVIAAPDGYHIFYTGHNPHLREQGLPEQAVMHAVSDDLLHWRKLPADTFCAPEPLYERHDWRDPFVFWNDEAREYWMLLAARQPGGPSRRRGCTALCASTDLHTWDVREPFWAPGLYFTHECPDLFRLGDWWYLLFSEFSEGNLTRYRMSRALAGPWLTPPDDAFDGRAFYAAKTASDGAHRYLFGWCASREGERDDGRWQWGGNLVVHELTARADGTLAVRPPESVVAAFSQPVDLAPEQRPALGEPCDHAICLTAPGSFVCQPVGPQPTCGKLTVTVRAQDRTRGCGLALCLSDDLEQGYYIRVEPQQQRLVFDLWPRPGDRPFVTGIERPLAVTPGEPLALTVLLDGYVCVVYAGGEVALSTRLYDLQQASARRWGVFVQQGAAQFDALGAWTLG